MSARREAAKRLGVQLGKLYEDLCLASGEEEIARASVMLGACFNENIEAICWFLKEYGGMQQPPLQPRRRRPMGVVVANDTLPKTPSILTD